MTVLRPFWPVLCLFALASARAEGPPPAPAPDNDKEDEDERPDKSAPKALRLRHLDSSVTCVAFSPDGKTLATGTEGGHVRLWKRGTGEDIQESGQGDDAVTALAFSPDGKLVAYTDGRKALHLWDPAREQTKELDGEAPMHGAAFSPDGKLVASIRDDGTLRLWETDTGKERPQLAILQEHAACTAFSPDGKLLAAAGEDGIIHLWELRSGKPLAACRGHTTEVSALAFSPDGKMLVSGARDATLRLWDAASGLELLRLVQHDQEEVSAVAFSGDGLLMASGSSEGRVQLWGLATGKSLLSFPGHPEERVCALAFSPDGKALLSGGSDDRAVIWTLPDSLLPKPMPPAEATPEALAALWDDLADPDPAKAYRAAWAMASAPEKTVPFLKERLQPLVVDPARIHQLVVDLDDDAFRTRDAAFHTLEELGPLAEQELRKAAKETDSAEVRERAGQLLDALATPMPASRGLRALVALDRIGTPEARGILARLASGPPEARETQMAKTILARADARP